MSNMLQGAGLWFFTGKCTAFCDFEEFRFLYSAFPLFHKFYKEMPTSARYVKLIRRPWEGLPSIISGLPQSARLDTSAFPQRPDV
jgi:hypothetical protein